MTIKNEINNLRDKDIYSLILFALYKIKDIPEYSCLSQLIYVLDKENLLKFCEYFGGVTIKVPTINELESLIYSLVMYQEIDVEGKEYNKVVGNISKKTSDIKNIKASYMKLHDILENYEFNTNEY